MPKRKDDAAAQTQKPDNDLEALPIPIQSFLWRQLRYVPNECGLKVADIKAKRFAQRKPAL